ncbi:MAG: tRNA (adenosine(37)-N6)-dimethylallyltransferase MiaA [Bacteroidales bacterium]|nr:tRNA (adenosine(37)-N6)-dimethylallyltransferase MiaA [Bacteroidales bacterium]MCF8344962.1 tRNA (adenosine(37)-N6)-dimethylallyltransferase MiaA [Bacteroidales bacterium]MCF8350570.1 tRNA (adenosine(37)-N6)-dimethylallyltransferase MiaA [Bacteroidales bacterium]MCF8377062.1 tRNA (adenosine(37)-N6)-dimethylallyltransferase MiaA [Bacteroidales bacterium]MCF8400936.1 tRNA (adenosine(37)-N6)-dimethylallyltransferase MiaA [Bacteroidales bacterium]
MITVLGPTATGKTKLAARLAAVIDAEIISADSRQVYKGMDIGTGKDLQDYMVEGREIPYHLIDIVDPGYEYNVFEFQQDFLKAYPEIRSRKKEVILCGGTGLYLEAIIKRYPLHHVPPNPDLREKLYKKAMNELIAELASKKGLHNVTDTTDRERLIRALEIAEFYERDPEKAKQRIPAIPNTTFGISLERKEIRERITKRLKQRLNEGMIEEAKTLLDAGLKPEQLMFYGLEYKFLTLYITGEISYDEMFKKLNTAIHQFAKRQMTWFRRMERKGVQIHWLPGQKPVEKNVDKILEIIQA